jgi:hypothetical protein
VKSQKHSEATPSVVGSLPEKVTPRDLNRLNEALAYIFHELRTAITLHQSNANAGREGVIHSVETTINFFSLFAPVILSSLHSPLAVLHDALMNLDDGRVLPLLKPSKKTGRPRASAMRGALIGAAAFTVKRLTETGMQAATAHKVVAHKLKSMAVRAGRGRAGTMTARTIRGWCEEVNADVGRRGEAAQTYDHLISDPRGRNNKLTPVQARSALLRRLASVVQKIRAQEGA